eukprot:TRINITY_DN3528_c0_g1_i1.p3 TRINITY_DN3528_c0_g1~~TRINITY_DN3528_c0_g1_i1.p3  ORF type:complete len:108 (-),score=3.16 TRINITY_DN3528_c0_g1_i1:609-932(-)
MGSYKFYLWKYQNNFVSILVKVFEGNCGIFLKKQQFSTYLISFEFIIFFAYIADKFRYVRSFLIYYLKYVSKFQGSNNDKTWFYNLIPQYYHKTNVVQNQDLVVMEL